MKKNRFILCAKGAAVAAAMVLFLPLVTPRLVNGQFAVFDASSWAALSHIWAQDVSNGTKLIEEYNQLVKIWTTGMQMYNLGMAMSRSFTTNQKGAWMTIAQLAVNDTTKDLYGVTPFWPQMINGMPGLTPQAWATATMPLTNTSYLGTMQVGTNPYLAHLATLNAMDGASVSCLQNVASYHANMAFNLPAILKLGISHLDGTADTNSTVEQLNMVNAHQEQGNTEQRAQGAISACLAEQQTLANKYQRDQLADNLNFAGQIYDYNQTADLNWGGSAVTITSYRPQ